MRRLIISLLRIKARADLIQHALRVRLLGAQRVHENCLAAVLVDVAGQVHGLQLLGALPPHSTHYVMRANQCMLNKSHTLDAQKSPESFKNQQTDAETAHSERKVTMLRCMNI